MKISIKSIVISFILLFAAQFAFASTAYYGLKKETVSAEKTLRQTQYVVLRNFTYDYYYSSAVFYNSGIAYNYELGPYSSGRDVITYEINYPDYKVCLRVTRAIDGWVPVNNCFTSSAYVDIGPYAAAKAKPEIKISPLGK